MSDIVERITAYLAGGGLFNPELANHDAVRDLLIDARAKLEGYREDGRKFFVRLDDLNALRAELAAVTAERDRMREALSYYAEEDYNGYNGSGACARAALEGVTEPLP